METWTVQKLLNWMKAYFEEKGIDAPRLSAELLLSHTLGCQRIDLYTNFDRVVDADRLDRLRKLVEPDPAHPVHIQTVWGFGYVFVPDGKA